MQNRGQEFLCALDPTGILRREVQRWEHGEYVSFFVEEFSEPTRVVLRFSENFEVPGPCCVMRFRREGSAADEVVRVIRSLMALGIEICVFAENRFTPLKTAAL